MLRLLMSLAFLFAFSVENSLAISEEYSDDDFESVQTGSELEGEDVDKHESDTTLSQEPEPVFPQSLPWNIAGLARISMGADRYPLNN